MKKVDKNLLLYDRLLNPMLVGDQNKYALFLCN